MTMRTPDQPFLRGTEAEAALTYAKICERFGIPVTLFVTGKLIAEDEKAIRALAQMENVELAGHGYDGFRPLWAYKFSGRFFGLKNGPRFWQRRQISMTLQLLHSLTGVQTLSWRNHALRYDKHTASILVEQGIKIWSDFTSEDSFRPYLSSGLVCVPINTLMDHDNMIHGIRNKEVLIKEAQKGVIRAEDVCSVEGWFERILGQVNKVLGLGGLATILAHPGCMELADNFGTFERLCCALKRFKAIQMRQVADLDLILRKGSENLKRLSLQPNLKQYY
jgi:peptidoglycan/xylan/chitin deacetylase (PgdA/CDA1 family)